MFNLDMPVLTRPAFDRKQSAAMDAVEITVGEFVTGFCMLAVALIYAEVPLRVFIKSMEPNELTLRRGGGLMSAPRTFAINTYLTGNDQFSCVLVRTRVQLDGMSCTTFRG
jgi:hypothetical protein